MKKLISVFPILALFLCFFVMNAEEADAAYVSKFYGNQTQTYFYVGAGWGSVEYDLYQEEDWSYNLTYKVGTSIKRQVSYGANYACPYTCELRFDNKYYNASTGTYITGQSMYAMSAGSYWDHLWAGGQVIRNYISPYDISTDIGQKLNVRTTMALWIKKDGGWIYGDSIVHSGFFY